MLGYIDRFGAEAVTGRRVLSAGQIRRMVAAENVYNAYMSRKASNDWGKWVNENPRMAAILAEVEGLLDGTD